MRRLIVGRLVHAGVVLLGVSFIAFSLMFLTGDPALLLLPPDASRHMVAEFRVKMGFDKPFHVQYARFLSRTLRGDLGVSTSYNQPALDLVAERFEATALLGLSAMTIAGLIALPVGIAAAVRPDWWMSRLAMGLAVVTYSVPVFWTGILLILLFSVTLGWLPASGYGGGLRSLILPSVTLSLQILPLLVRLVWSGMVDVLREDYVRTARAKGLSEYRVWLKHGLRNASLPVVTVFGLETAGLLGGAVLTETVFSWPGLGRLTVEAIFQRDYTVVQVSLLFLAFVFVAVNLFVDIMYAWLDPRLRKSEASRL